jgi:hypothetical protein
VTGRGRCSDRYAEEKRRFGVNEALNGLPPDPHGDSRLDRALTLGLRGENSGYIGCNWCHDLPHRRAQPNCHGCGEAYAAEVVTLDVPALQSSYPSEEIG